uniref:transcription initiation factor TFIID subunit 4-like isoform X2 n=1 Tax=Myxine glutinosa TaxID=7769 RepID=UPI00358F0479
MQQQEQAEIRQREANLTALAAIGPRKKPRLDPGTTCSAGEGPSSLGSQTVPQPRLVRPRPTRVCLRDLAFLLEQERETRHSLLLFRTLLM